MSSFNAKEEASDVLSAFKKRLSDEDLEAFASGMPEEAHMILHLVIENKISDLYADFKSYHDGLSRW